MSLMLGTGPFGAHGGTLVAVGDDHHLLWEPWPRRMRAVVAGRTVLDSREGMLLHETGRFATHWFRSTAVAAELLERSSSADRPDPHLGPVRRWHLRVGDRLVEDAVKSFPDPPSEAGFLSGWISLRLDSADRWFEEDEPVYAHTRDPYHRVDVRASSRHVVVRHGGTVLADTERPKLLFETGVPVRYYVPFADVRVDLLTLSDTVSECPYKGDGQHWHLDVRGERIDDVGWSLPHPLPEGFPAIEHVSFYADKVEVSVDGEVVSEPSLT